MGKRLLDCSTSDWQKMTKKEILAAIAASEGRVLVSEVIGALPPLLFDISNAELVAACGADLILLNMLDLDQPEYFGLPPHAPGEVIRVIKRLTGRLIGVNLEAVDETTTLPPGRRASAQNARKAREMGADFIVLTGNPGTAASNRVISNVLAAIDQEVGDELIIAAGKMHAAGVRSESGERLVTAQDVEEFIQAGCDIILLPAPGTVPGITVEYIKGLVQLAHARGVLTMTTVGTSQEGADEQTIREIALLAKMTGTDLHHLGDAGYPGIAVPENIIAYSIAIRGRRHTYRRMACSINR
ncbi:MAG: haloacid dehalogenase-like hydrolase [Firmicutes bacterium]|nr:haloacid dehalogenase-like hydrolase [Bacillota bacterium]